MGAPQWKSPRAERQLSGSEETRVVNPSLPLGCPSRCWRLSPRILGPRKGHVLCCLLLLKDMASGEGRKEGCGLDCSVDKGDPHMGLEGKSKRAQGRKGLA